MFVLGHFLRSTSPAFTPERIICTRVTAETNKKGNERVNSHPDRRGARLRCDVGQSDLCQSGSQILPQRAGGVWMSLFMSIITVNKDLFIRITAQLADGF